ncbi:MULTISPECIES: nitrilase-related carbon-nitrogen hydrolase [unclassified Adlercreutzia]|uniref:nitrilase-related carbon-nitrogen hydrolase n=1 Tax=unclassified Adlercreutzia TaxID=2636013 RepID=UPI0013ECE9B7|nr:MULTISPECIES: nitrilase-related carbon-nitrogen hydrolase [unclassified Adlercreutzia]
MTFRLGLAQCTHPADGDVIALVERCARDAQAAGVDLLAFPECLMTPFEKTREDFLASAEPLDGAFSQEMSRIAAAYNLWMVYTMNERADGAEEGLAGSRAAAGSDAPAADVRLPYNTAVVVDGAGTRRGFYRKIHLFDAGDCRESERMAAGGELFAPIDTPFCKLGLAICYDLRFPEVMRAAACAGCELFVLPAAWVDGPRKADQWTALLTARAVENEMYVAGLSRADERCIGCSRVVDPFGATVAEAPGKTPALLTADIDLARVRAARAAVPVFEHRRPSLY